jgi:glucose/arabinose dehydrogenase
MGRNRRLPAAALIVIAAGVACASVAVAGGEQPRRAETKVLAGGLDVPWGVAFLPSGDGLVSERSTGRIYRVPRSGGKAKRVMRVPKVDRDAGEGGLLGIAVSPRYRKDRLVYAYLTTKRDNRIVRFRLGGKVHPILTGIRRNTYHDGGQIAFGPDGKLYAGTGDAGRSPLAQKRGSLNGKILRMNPDGSVPRTNPGKRSPVWSRGHRNVQGFDWDRKGRMWASELGQDRFDEVNLIRRGGNYGWPKVEGRGGGKRFIDPKVVWSPAKASPSGAGIRGRTLYVAALRGERLWRIRLHGTRAGKPKAMLQRRYGRLRAVEPARGGAVWLTTSNDDGDDRVIRLGR